MTRRPVAPSGEEGFALLAAIWFAALTALVAVIVSGWMVRSLDMATRLQDRLEARAALLDAENEIAFRLVSGFFSMRGLELPRGDVRERAMAPGGELGFGASDEVRYLALDDRPYALGATVVRLRDDRGLYAINHPDRGSLGNLLRVYGVRYEDRDRLVDTLLDYQDKAGAGLRRVNGAVAADYQRAGRSPPRESPLLTPWEPLRVLSWDNYPALWRGPDALPNVTTIGASPQINPNTAPAPILRSLPGMDEDAVEHVLHYRSRFVITSQVDFNVAAARNLPIDPMALIFFPSGRLRVTILSPKDPLVHRLAFSLTPLAGTPYRVDYAVDLPADDEARALAGASDLPKLEDDDVGRVAAGSGR